MMLFYLTARIVSSAAAFLYPGYASYKTLSQRPASEEELERWLMYWSVLGCLVGVEYLAEWLVSCNKSINQRVPFYYTLKTLFLLYLALPQTQGASYVYQQHLSPFFHAHETQIDAALASLKVKAYKFIQERLRALWDAAAASLQGPNAAGATGAQQSSTVAGQPTLVDPVSGPAQLAGSLWRTYGPGIMASGATLLRSAAAAATTSASESSTRKPLISRPTSETTERRKQLEAELAALGVVPETVIPQTRGSTSRPSSSLSDLGMRERTNSNSRFEEIEVPSDVEGYDVDDHERELRPSAVSRGSWFGWGSGQGKGGYERVKSE
ncbi:hypothetical protein C0991_012221 [Blastosporella zonata]|nr:hypothetical protein C0991_012221 [Blastosporella zonata]